MTAQTFLVILVGASAPLALWAYVRLEHRAPDTLGQGLLHCGLALGASALGVPLLRSAITHGIEPGAALMVIVLPSFTYMLLASLWMLRLVQQLLPGIGRR